MVAAILVYTVLVLVWEASNNEFWIHIIAFVFMLFAATLCASRFRLWASVAAIAAAAVVNFSAGIFPLSDPLGDTIRIRNMAYLVVGVMKPRVPMAGIGGSLAAQDFSDDVYIPITTFWRRIGDRTLTISAGQRSGQEVQISQITFEVHTVDQVLPTARSIENTMARLHKKFPRWPPKWRTSHPSLSPPSCASSLTAWTTH